MKIRHPVASCALGLCLTATVGVSTAAGATPKTTDEGASATHIATINDETYPLDLFRLFYFERMREEQAENNPAFQERAFNEFINLALLAQEGARRGLDEQPQVRQTLALEEMRVLSNAMQQAVLQEAPPTEKELEEAYEAFVSERDRTEYRARHILVDDEQQAKDLIGELDDGADFAALAKEHSLGPTGKEGGELDWFSAGQMVKPFSDAVRQLEPGAYTEAPIRTQFGWHVIRLDETRQAQPPSLEEAKPRLRAALQRQKLAEEITALRQAADIELNEDVVKLESSPTEANP